MKPPRVLPHPCRRRYLAHLCEFFASPSSVSARRLTRADSSPPASSVAARSPAPWAAPGPRRRRRLRTVGARMRSAAHGAHVAHGHGRRSRSPPGRARGCGPGRLCAPLGFGMGRNANRPREPRSILSAPSRRQGDAYPSPRPGTVRGGRASGRRGRVVCPFTEDPMGRRRTQPRWPSAVHGWGNGASDLSGGLSSRCWSPPRSSFRR